MTAILDQFGSPIQTAATPRGRWFSDARPKTEGSAERRWEAGEVSRLNDTRWAKANGVGINDDLASYLDTIVMRSSREAANNGIVEGMIATHMTDICGDHGPSLQVLTERNNKSAKEWATQAERNWKDNFWKRPDITGQMSGADWLCQCINMLWQRGEFLTQKVLHPDRSLPVRLRLLPIDPRRLVQPADRAQASRTNLGIKRTKQGKPLTYYIADESGRGSSDSISARNMIHQFEIKEPGQARGIPWLASVLQVIADLRDYDAEVLDAARQATYWAIALTTTHPNVDPLVQSETTEIEKRTIATMPPGWNATPMTPPQPSTNYVDYRGERMRDIGRPRQMPAMLVRLDSSKHNYSSARFDSQMYNRGNSRSQAWFERNTLNALVEDVTREGELTKAISAKRPEFFELFWIWPKPPHVDPVKEALAERIRLKNRTLSLTDALAVHNKDFDAHVEQLKTEEEAFEEAGVALNLEGSSSQTARPRSDGANNMVRDLVVDLFGQEIAKRVLNKTNGKANGHPGRIQHVNS